MVPTVELPPGMAFTCQSTAILAVFATMATNCTSVPTIAAVELGTMLTVITRGGVGGSGGDVPPPPPLHDSKPKASNTTAQESDRRGYLLDLIVSRWKAIGEEKFSPFLCVSERLPARNVMIPFDRR